MQQGTKLFVSGSSWECSTFLGDHFDYGTTEDELRTCAQEHDLQTAPKVFLDGKSGPITEVETPLVENIVAPENNIFDALSLRTAG